MTRTAFPLSKSGGKAYRLGNRRWRVVTFQIGAASYRLLINYSHTLGQYQAMLGLEAGGDTKVIASLELHPTHGGWHIHSACEDDSHIPSGIKRGPWVKNVPIRVRPFDSKCPANDSEAFQMAVNVFRLTHGIVGPLGI